MKLVDQVCSLDLAKRLKDLGVGQESLFCYANGGLYSNPDFLTDNQFAAFTVAELGEMLPPEWSGFELVIEKTGPIGWQIKYVERGYEDETRGDFFFDISEANARAKMLIYLIENKIINPTKQSKEGV